MASKMRSDEEKKEIYKRWCELINMSEEELLSWAKDPDRLKASLNRARAKSNGGIQSGLDSLHRIKRRYSKPRDEWSAKDYDNASQENSFNSRMLGNDPGKVVSGTGMSKWEISLRNWGHAPSKKSSPAYGKWSKWKDSHKEEIKESRKKTASESHIEVVQDLVSTYVWENSTLNNHLKRASEVLGMDWENKAGLPGVGSHEIVMSDRAIDAMIHKPGGPTELEKEIAEMWEQLVYSSEDDNKDGEVLFLLSQIILKNKYKFLRVNNTTLPLDSVQTNSKHIEEGDFVEAFHKLKQICPLKVKQEADFSGVPIGPVSKPLMSIPAYGTGAGAIPHVARIVTKKLIRRLQKPDIEK